MKPFVILVGADKGGVGKTTVSRALLDYLTSRNVVARAFDTEHPRGTLKRFHQSQTEIVDITSTSDQMRIFDTLLSAGPKVSMIDVRAGQLGASLRALQEVGFLDAVKAREFSLVVLHVLGPSIASLDEIEETAPFIGDASYFLVKNFINDTTFFEWDPQTFAHYFRKAPESGELVVPKLNAMAYEQVELAGTPFSTFVADRRSDGSLAGHSFVLRGYVRTWLRNVSAEFDRVGIPKLFEDKPPPAPAKPEKRSR